VGGGRATGSEVKPRKKVGLRGKMLLRFVFYFSLSYSDLIGNEEIIFSQVESVLPVTVMGD